eukprot:m.215927 g.215927  ORF g.215927 m.215927 type:complete len:141 (+) comp33196_c0_seq3:222-644(+)
MDKLGSWVDPLDTVTNGSLHSHGIRDGVAFIEAAGRYPPEPQAGDNGGIGGGFFAVDSLDAFLADPVTATNPATNFLWPLSPLAGPVVGFDMQLHQNTFATNMPLFSLDSDFRWRFKLRARTSAAAAPTASSIRTPIVHM